MMPGFLTRSNRSNLQTICSQTPPPHEPDVFWHQCSSVCSRIGQRHRLQQVDIARIGLDPSRSLFVCPEHPTRQVSPHSIVRRLAGVRYQLDFELAQAWIVGRGHQQEDPAFESPCKYAYTDAILPNVLTPLASRFETHGIRYSVARTAAEQQPRWECSQSRASERPREASWV